MLTDFQPRNTRTHEIVNSTSHLSRIHAEESFLVSRKGREDRKGKHKSCFGNSSLNDASAFEIENLVSPHLCVRRVLGVRVLTESFRFRVCLKSLRSECGRPRPQHCPTSKGSRFLQRHSQCHVAAPEDGRTPSEFVFTPKCIFKLALSLVPDPFRVFCIFRGSISPTI